MTNPYDRQYFEQLVGTGRIIRKDYRHFLLRGVIRILRSVLTPHSLVLDVACGDGFYVSSLRSHGFNVFGTDLSRSGIQRRNPSIPLRMAQADICALPFGGSVADCVLMLDVVEHLADPKMALAEAYRVLRPGGYLLLSTPNPESVGSRVKAAAWFGYRDSTHVSIFSRTVWRTFLREAGIEIMRDGTDSLWDIPYPIPLPVVLQKTAGVSINAILRSTRVFLPWGYGENYYAFCRKERAT